MEISQQRDGRKNPTRSQLIRIHIDIVIYVSVNVKDENQTEDQETEGKEKNVYERKGGSEIGVKNESN